MEIRPRRPILTGQRVAVNHPRWYTPERGVDERQAKKKSKMSAAGRAKIAAAAKSRQGHFGLFGLDIFCDGLGAAVDVQFVVDVAQVVADGVRAEFEVVGDFLVGLPFGNEPEHLHFAQGQAI